MLEKGEGFLRMAYSKFEFSRRSWYIINGVFALMLSSLLDIFALLLAIKALFRNNILTTAQRPFPVDNVS